MVLGLARVDPTVMRIVGGTTESSEWVSFINRSGHSTELVGIGWGSGTVQYPYLITPVDAIKARATGTTVSQSLSDTDLNAAATAANGKDYALVFITG